MLHTNKMGKIIVIKKKMTTIYIFSSAQIHLNEVGEMMCGLLDPIFFVSI